MSRRGSAQSSQPRRYVSLVALVDSQPRIPDGQAAVIAVQTPY
jgi:hypothetical protein